MNIKYLKYVYSYFKGTLKWMKFNKENNTTVQTAKLCVRQMLTIHITTGNPKRIDEIKDSVFTNEGL